VRLFVVCAIVLLVLAGCETPAPVPAPEPPKVQAPEPEAPPPPPPPPPEPVRPVTHDYSWPAQASDAAKVFSLVLKDGTVRFAIAVWIQDDMLHYVMQDRTAGRTPLDALDREATRRLNAEGRLNLTLPPE